MSSSYTYISLLLSLSPNLHKLTLKLKTRISLAGSICAIFPQDKRNTSVIMLEIAPVGSRTVKTRATHSFYKTIRLWLGRIMKGS